MAYQKETIVPNEKYAISFASGDFKIGKNPDINLWCLDNALKPCSVVVPRLAWEKMDNIITQYSQEQKMATTCCCRKINTNNPVMMPAKMSLETYHDYFISLSKYMAGKIKPPDSLSKDFLQLIEFVENNPKSSIELQRQVKNLNKSDYFSRDQDGNLVEIYITSLIGEKKTYSAWDIYKAKFKNMF